MKRALALWLTAVIALFVGGCAGYTVPSRVKIATTSLPSGAVGVSYSAALSAANGVAPYTWTLVSGQVPPGLSLQSGGQISGTPSQAGTFSFSVQVKDSSGSTAKASFSINIGSPSTPVVSSISPSSGPTSGGTAVTISGANFASGATVTFGGTAAASVTVSGSSQIQAVTPSHIAGSVGVMVQVNGQSSTSSVNFTYTSQPTAAALSIQVLGNHFVGGSGQPVRLLAINVPLTTDCSPAGNVPINQQTITTLASWHVNAIRLGMDEECWLGINGETGVPQSTITNFVSMAHNAGMYVILLDQYAATGTNHASNDLPGPTENATAFWTSVASTFKNDPAVIFEPVGEPHGANTWTCLLNGGCTLTDNAGNNYTAIGMQSIVNTIRAQGATTQPITYGGLSYATDLSQFVANMPSDPSQSIVADYHIYDTYGCDSSCAAAQVDLVLGAGVPVITGELGEFDCAHSFIDTYMAWADAHSPAVSYMAWAWNTGGCSVIPALISDYSGTPTNYGAGFKNHLIQAVP